MMGIAEPVIGRAFARPVGSTHPTELATASYSLQVPFLSMPSFTASAAAKVGTGLLTLL
jgi:hypothetical protein